MYKRIFKEADSISDLTDVSIPEKIRDFFMENPFPQDHDGFHKFAEDELGIDADIAEQYVYAFLSLIFAGGKSPNKDVTISDENMKMGKEVEAEHVSYDTDNKVILKMIDIIEEKIIADHLVESDKYYEALLDMEKNL